MSKILLTAISLLLLCGQLLAQNKMISGRITHAADGTPLAGVTVHAKGTNTYAQTGPDGTFNISVPSSARALVFTSVGLASQEVQIGNRSTINISLSTQSSDLNEVVVTALGITRDKRSLGYASH